MMKRMLIGVCCAISLCSCQAKNGKLQTPAAEYFPVTAFLNGEIARMENSLSSFIKIETVNGLRDTVPIKNSEVKIYAKDFLLLPDITTDQLRPDYEVTKQYDELLDAFVFLFTTKEDHPIKREDVVVGTALNAEGKNDVRSIFIDFSKNSGDTTIRKSMLWETGKSFQVSTTSTWHDKEVTKQLQVSWNSLDK